MTRLDNIATRQSQTRVRDAFFAACVALATAISITTVSTASHAAKASPAPTVAVAQASR